MKVKSESEVAQSCPTLSLPGSSIHGIFQARVLKWGAIAFSVCFIDYAKTLTVWITTNWKILKEMGISDHLTCLLRNLCVDQEAKVRTGHGKINWLKMRKGLHQDCVPSPCLFNLYTEYSMRNPGLDEVEAGIKITGRNINNLRYADDTTLMAESEEELNSLLMKVKEESEKVGVKLNI